MNNEYEIAQAWMADEDQLEKAVKLYRSGLEHYHKGQKEKGKRLIEGALQSMQELKEQMK